MQKKFNTDDVQPEWDENMVPQCSESCKSHDGKRCELLGYRPDSVCEPMVTQLSKRVFNNTVFEL